MIQHFKEIKEVEIDLTGISINYQREKDGKELQANSQTPAGNLKQ